MAAAGGGSAAVSVLAPSGRRVTVRVGPGTVLLQILEEVCRKQGGSPGEYGLKFQRSVLDLSLQWRFARLPNNAKLEMVPVSSRVGVGNTVRIALQLDDGSRLQDTFLCQQTLWELLNCFAKISWKPFPGMLSCSECVRGSIQNPLEFPLGFQRPSWLIGSEEGLEAIVRLLLLSACGSPCTRCLQALSDHYMKESNLLAVPLLKNSRSKK